MKPIVIQIILVVALIVGTINTSHAQSAEQLYQKGLVKEQGEGALQEAIVFFNQVADNPIAGIPLRAKALLHVGMCFEKLGKQEATKAYQRLVNNFPSQKNEVAIARERLSRLILAVEKLAQKEESKDLVIRKFMEGTGSEFYGAPSPDGKYFAFVDYKTFPNDIIIKDIETENEIRLRNQSDLNHEGDEGTPYNPIWSPDSKQIAYVWENDKDNFYKLLVITVESPKPELLFRVSYNNGWIKTEDWSPDGKNILVQLTENNIDQLGLVSVINGSFQQLKIIGKTAPYSAKFSPDGKFVAFDNPLTEENTEHDIFVLSSDGKQETKITFHPSHDYFLEWSPSGDKILFASDRTGTTDMWSISFNGKSTSKTPELVSENIGNIKAMGSTNGGSFYYSTPGSWWDIYSTTINPESGKVIAPPTEIPLPYQGFNRHPVWSPDGKYLAYVSVRRHLRKPNILCIYTKETGEVKEFSFKKDVDWPVWFPDSQSVLLFGTDVLNTTTGKIESVIQLKKEAGLEKFAISISSDGKSIYYETRNESWDKHAIVKINIENGDEKELYTTTDDNLTMALSPDNKQLALLQRNNENTRILKLLSTTDSSEKVIYTFKQNDFGYIDIIWSPDGKNIYFSKLSGTNEKRPWELWSIPATGGEAQNLGVAMYLFTHISFRPDGRSITFNSFVGKEKPGGVWVMENFLPLEKLEQKPEIKDLAIRKALANTDIDPLGSPSPDGRYISFIDWNSGGNVGILNLDTKERRLLTDFKDPNEQAYYSSWSPDGKQIAYFWWRYDKDQYNLSVVDVEKAESRVLFISDKNNWIELGNWSSDGRYIFATLSLNDEPKSQIIRVSAADGTIKVLKTCEESYTGGKPYVSPDNRYVTYDLPDKDASANSDIFIISLENGQENTLIKHPSHDYLLGWTPDGKNILFASDRSGTVDAMTIAIENGKPAGNPKSVKQNIGPIVPMGFTQKGLFYYGQWLNADNIYSAEINFDEGKILSNPTLLVQKFEGRNYSPDYSSDGKYLAYISGRGILTKGTPGRVLCIRNLETGHETEITPDPEISGRISDPQWSPDDRSIALTCYNKYGYSRIYSYDTQTKELTPLVTESEGQASNNEYANPVWSKDGKSLFYLQLSRYSTTSRILVRNISTGVDRELYSYSSDDFMDRLFNISLSPDGKWLAAINRGENRVLKIFPAEGGNPIDLYRFKLPGGWPFTQVWGSDGKYIVFPINEEDSGWSLMRIAIDGGKKQKIALNLIGISSLSLHPNGRTLAFRSAGYSLPENNIWEIKNFLQE